MCTFENDLKRTILLSGCWPVGLQQTFLRFLKIFFVFSQFDEQVHVLIVFKNKPINIIENHKAREWNGNVFNNCKIKLFN